MIDYSKCVMAILKKKNGAKYFIREGGRISSVLTMKCLFSREKAWAVSREFNEIFGTNEVIVFRTVDENTGFIGKTPEEILSAKKDALSKWCGKKKSTIKEKGENEKKKKKTSATSESVDLFSDLGENRNTTEMFIV